MIEIAQNQYVPNVVSPPGETLLETIEALGMSQVELSERMGRPVKTISEIINAKTAITPGTALQLERVLGVPARFWLNREQQYQEWRARQREEQRLVAEQGWLSELPVAEMIDRGWVAKQRSAVDQMRELLRFFAVASPAQWREVWMNPAVAFRQSLAYVSDGGSVAAWLRKGEIEAQALDCSSYDAFRFKQVLQQVRSHTTSAPKTFLPVVQEACANAGVAFVVVPSLSQCRASGATSWLIPGKAMLLLSLRYRTDDQFWFSFFHEAGHIVLHGKRDAFLDGGETPAEGADGDRMRKEQEADAFAADLLIASSAWTQFVAAHSRYSKDAICAFAEAQGVAPGIVVGRLQHEQRLPYTHCNDLKKTLDWII
jgi:addiction module HigA family antidote